MKEYSTYSIARLAELLNVSKEAIRKYEAEGIIEPIRNAENNYRLYTAWDIAILLYARKLKQTGFTLSETADILNCMTPDEFVNVAEQHKLKLVKEIQQLEQMIKGTEELRKSAEDCSNLQDQFRIELRPAYWYIPVFEEFGLQRDYKKSERINDWADKHAMLTIVTIHDGEKRRGGLCMEIDPKEAHLINTNYGEEYLPSCLCVTTTVIGTNSNPIEEQSFESGLAYLKEHGLKLTGLILVTSMYISRKSDEHHFICKAWFPIGKKLG